MKNDFDTGIRIKISSFVTPLFLTRGITGVYKGWINIHTKHNYSNSYFLIFRKSFIHKIRNYRIESSNVLQKHYKYKTMIKILWIDTILYISQQQKTTLGNA